MSAAPLGLLLFFLFIRQQANFSRISGQPKSRMHNFLRHETREPMSETKKFYRLPTAIAMIVGICIGSGIFFKSDNILAATGGSVTRGILVFLLGAVGIVFGGLSVAQLAARTSRSGGVVAYAEEFVSPGFACGAGWFQSFVYFPTLVAAVSRAAGHYFCSLFSIADTLETQCLTGFLMFTLCFLWNLCSARLGGLLQNAATVLKLFPLLLVAVCGLFAGDPQAAVSHAPDVPADTSWLSAIGPIAFAYDGWIISTTISHELKDAQRNMPRALLIAPLFVTAVYILYFLGVSSLLGPETALSMGDRHVALLAQRLLGPIGAKLMLLFILIAVAGTLNGVILGYLRLPPALAQRGMFPCSHFFTGSSPFLRALPCYAASCIWTAANYLCERFAWLPNADVSEVPIVMGYLIYAVLYCQVFRLWRRGQIRGFLRGALIPALALFGAGIVLWGGLQSGAHLFYAGFCLLVIVAGFLYGRIKRN